MELRSRSLPLPMKRPRVWERDSSDRIVSEALQPRKLPKIDINPDNRFKKGDTFRYVTLTLEKSKRQPYSRDRDSKNENMSSQSCHLLCNVSNTAQQIRLPHQEYHSDCILDHGQSTDRYDETEDTHMDNIFPQSRELQLPVEPLFDGSNCSWKTFLQQLELYARHYSWSMDEYKTQLLMFMEGEALSYVTSLHYRTLQDPDALLQALEGQFGHRHLLDALPETPSAGKYGPESWQDFDSNVYMDDIILIFFDEHSREPWM